MTKKVKTLIGALILGGSLVAVCIKLIYKDINLDLNKTDQIMGHVIELGIMDKSSIVGVKTKVKGKCFYFKLDNLAEILATYRPEQNYSALTNNLHIGDKIKVYYRAGTKNELNLNVFQIEKNEQIIQDYKSYNKNHQSLALLTGVLGTMMIGFGIFAYKKGWI
jgi:hypothetical protein